MGSSSSVGCEGMIARGVRTTVLAAAGALMMTAGTAARADEPLFGYVNTTDLLPEGKVQVEEGLTLRGGGDFQLLESRTEVDYGLSSDLQLTGYVNASRLDARLTPAQAPAIGASGGLDIERSRGDSVTVEAIWRVASPYLHPVGVAFLTDATVGRDPPALGFKAIAQKNFNDDTVVLAANLRLDVGQRETLPAQGGRPARSRHVSRIEAALGASWRFRPNWSAAVELRARNRYADDRLQDAAVYAGPTLHYGAQRWFVTLTALGRLGAHHRAVPAGQLASAAVQMAERTRWDGIRLRVGRTF